MSLYTKYRPKNFSDLVGQDHIRDTLEEAAKQGRIAHAYLFAGPRGVGKTSAARILAKAANCTGEVAKEGEPCGKCDSCKEIALGRALDVIEIDAASNRGIDEIRELREQVKFAPAKLKRKVYIIDEVHMLTREAFNALLKTLEEPPAHAMFVMATTEPHKIPATIISRTQRFDFRRITKDDIIKNLKEIVKAEKVKISDEALDLIAAMAEGSHRDAITILEQVLSHSKDVNLEDAQKILGVAKAEEVIKIVRAIFNSKPEEGLKIAHDLAGRGQSIAQLNFAIIEQLRRVFLYLTTEKTLFDDTKENTEKIIELAEQFKSRGGTSESIVLMIEVFVEAGALLKESAFPVLPIEMGIVESCGLATNNKAEIKDNKDIEEIKKKDGEFKNKRTEEPQNQETEGHKNVKKQNLTSDGILNQDRNPSVTLGMTTSVQDDTIKDQSDSLSQAPRDNIREKLTADSPASPAGGSQLEASGILSDDVWKKIIETTKSENNSLAALLRDAKPIGGSGEELVLGVKFKFHQDKISEIQNIQILESVLCKVTGSNMRVKCQIADLRPRVAKPATDDELQKAAEEIFNE
jgi:DNA polymerase-3 subunit gamma/tau